MRELKDYDTRRFHITDTKDVLAFLDLMVKAEPMIRSVLRKQTSKLAAQASVITSLRRGQTKPQTPDFITQDETVVEEVAPEITRQDKEEMLSKMKFAATGDGTVITLESGLDNDVKVKDENNVSIGIHGIRMMILHGKPTTRWTLNGIPTKENNIPSDVRPRLQDALKKVQENHKKIITGAIGGDTATTTPTATVTAPDTTSSLGVDTSATSTASPSTTNSTDDLLDDALFDEELNGDSRTEE